MALIQGALGWASESMGTGLAGYLTDGTRKVGMPEQSASCMIRYLAVDDIVTSVAEIQTQGGSLMGEIVDTPGFGRFATCTDPRGVWFRLH